MESGSGSGGKLLEGSQFDEAASHKEFADAVAAWRSAPANDGAAAAVPSWSMPAMNAPEMATFEGIQTETSTPSSFATQSSTIAFAPSLTYMEQLLLKRNKVSLPAAAITPSTAIAVSCVTDDTDEAIEHQLASLGLEERISWLSEQLSILRAEADSIAPSTRTARYYLSRSFYIFLTPRL